ncbi:hypothetical protein Bca4012_056990 [Brassica carinata]
MKLYALAFHVKPSASASPVSVSLVNLSASVSPVKLSTLRNDDTSRAYPIKFSTSAFSGETLYRYVFGEVSPQLHLQ